MNFLTFFNKQLQRSLNIKRFLTEKISLEECQELIKKGMDNREDNFLFSVKNLIYEQKRSPYLELLKVSHINYEDIKKMVSREGIEGTLRILKEEGVYITFEEFKGQKELKRKGHTFRFQQKNFSNLFQRGTGEVYSGASRGPGTMIHWNSGYLMQKVIHEAMMFDVHKCFNAPSALWYPTFPAQTGLYTMRLKKLGIPPEIWFFQVKRVKPETLYEKVLFYFSSMFERVAFEGVPFRHVSLKDAYIIAEWAAQKIKDYSACSISTFVSAAVRICIAAKERGLNIKNTKFFISGEPLTERKRKEIEELGCKIVNTYYFSEGGFVGCSCDNPNHKVDEMHFFKDSFSIIQHFREIEKTGQKVNAFLFTSLYPDCPIVMLNMENGDYGVIEEKQCGCLFDSYGFNDHMYNVRSYEKITAEGQTYFINDMANVIEEVFPAEFGGSSIDY